MNSLVLAGSAAALSACGQKGNLYFPSESAAAQRASLVETLTPLQTPPPLAPPAQLLNPPAAVPATPASAPATP